jgi:LmbE family N-acetylglucosaminyl deacetylase
MKKLIVGVCFFVLVMVVIGVNLLLPRLQQERPEADSDPTLTTESPTDESSSSESLNESGLISGTESAAEEKPITNQTPDSSSNTEYESENTQESEPGFEAGLEPEPEPNPGPEPTPEPLPAFDLTDSLTIRLSDERQPTVLLDRNYNTGLVFGADAYLTITAPEKIHSLYLIWGLPPGEWSVGGLSAQVFGENGFIHEYADLAYPTHELVINLPSDGATLRDIYAFTEGTPPEWVQTWLPPVARADLLLFPTHADDEFLFFAGILPYYAGERGYNVQVAYMTHHWNEPPRPHELLNGLWITGVRNYPIISEFIDRYAGSMERADAIFGFENFVDYQVEQIRRFKPLVVIGHYLEGEYEQGVHILAAHTLLNAVENAAVSSYHPDSVELYGVWDAPKFYLHLYRENSIMMNWNIPLKRFGGATAYEMAVAGFDAHRSQHHWGLRVPRPGNITGHRFGLVRSLVGEDITGGDVFENLWHRISTYEDILENLRHLYPHYVTAQR